MTQIISSQKTDGNTNEPVLKFDIKDGIISIAYYFYNIIINYLFGLLCFKTTVYSDLMQFFNIHNEVFYRFIFFIPICVAQIMPIFIWIKIRNQGLKSIGIRKDKILKSIVLGILFAIPFITLPIIRALNQNMHIMSSNQLLWSFLYYLLVIGFVEELIFRAFIQTRIQGLIKIKWISILVVAIMCSSMHIPFQMLKSNIPLNEFIPMYFISLIYQSFMHIYLLYLYKKDNDIISVSTTHLLLNFIPSIFYI